MDIPGYVYDSVRNRYFKKQGNTVIHPGNSIIGHLNRTLPLHKLCLLRELGDYERLRNSRHSILKLYGNQFLHETKLRDNITHLHITPSRKHLTIIENQCNVTFNEKVENILEYCNIDDQLSDTVLINRENRIRTSFPGRFSLFAIDKNDKSFALVTESFDHRPGTLFVGRDLEDSSLMVQFGLFRGAIHSLDISIIANSVAFSVDQDYNNHYVCMVPIMQNNSSLQNLSKLHCNELTSDILSLSIGDGNEGSCSLLAGCRNGSLLLWSDLNRANNKRPDIFPLFKKSSISSIIRPPDRDDRYVLLSTTTDELYLIDNRRCDMTVWKYDNAPCSSHKHPIRPVVGFDDSRNDFNAMYTSAVEHAQIAMFRYIESPHPFIMWPLSQLHHYRNFELKQIVPLDLHSGILPKEKLLAIFG